VTVIVPNRNLVLLAPLFARALLDRMNAAWRAGLDPVIHEGLRTQATQDEYFRTGATQARSIWKSHHAYGCAVDVISKSKGWDNAFYAKLAPIFKETGLLKWGGDWTSFIDRPHFYWHKFRASPSAEAKRLYDAGGIEAVWKAVGAL
jgi:hypothetical protein